MSTGNHERVFDGDNHYYEAVDAFTRHLDPRTGDRTIRWVETGKGRRYHLVGGKISRVISNPTFDPISPPGAAYDFFHGNPNKEKFEEILMGQREPIRPEYRERDARIKKMDSQGVDCCWLFPTLGVLYEELLRHDPWAVMQSFRAFNRWLQEDWGCNYKDRIFAAPYLSLADVDEAIVELEWALQNDARVICLRPAAATTITGQLSPAAPLFDPFWARVNESGISVVLHAGDSGYSTNGYTAQEHRGNGTLSEDGKPSIKLMSAQRSISDFLATVIFDKLFDRFPNLRLISVENGSSYIPNLLKQIELAGARVPGYFSESPRDTFMRHVWVNPFWEDDVGEMIALMGEDRVVFGSDWPHLEGLVQPRDILQHIDGVEGKSRDKFLFENAKFLNTRRPA
jgi:predicted TIM-barrel fold metal-dependent hydrolase